MTPTELRILAIALSAIDDVDARVVLADAIEESGWRSRYRDAAGVARWMVHYDPPDLKAPAFYAAELLTADWHNPDDPANEAEAWFPYSVRISQAERWRRMLDEAGPGDDRAMQVINRYIESTRN